MIAPIDAIASELVGVPSVPWTYEVTRPGIRRYARVFGFREHIYYIVDAAREAGWPDLPAPFGYLGEAVYIPGLSDEVFPDPGGQLDVGVSEADVLDLGTHHEVIRVPCAGEQLTCVTTVLNIQQVTYRAGTGAQVEREMLFRDQAGEIVLRHLRRTLYFYGQ